MTARSRLSVIGFRHFSPPMGDPVQVSLPASEVPRTPAGPAGGGPGSACGPSTPCSPTAASCSRRCSSSAPIPKALVDLDGHVLVANPMLCALTGRTAEELAGRHVDLLAHPDDPPVGDLGLVPGPERAGHLDPNLLLDGERRLRRSDGTELWVVQSHEIVRHNNGDAAVRRPLAGRRHRPPPRRGGPGPPRVHRPADRPAQPPRADRPAAARRRAVPPPRPAGRAGAPQHRPLQGGQRLPRPRGRRPAAEPGRRPAALEHPGRGHRRPARRRRVPRRRRGRRGPRRAARAGRPAAQRARRAVPRPRPRDQPLGQRRAHPRRGHHARRPAAPGAERAHPRQGRRQPGPHRGARGRAHPGRRRRPAAGDRPQARARQRGAAALLPADRPPRPTRRCSATRRSSAGSTRPAGCCPRPPSSTPPRTTGSPRSSAPGCCTAPAPTPPPGPTTCASTSTSPPATWPRRASASWSPTPWSESGLAPDRLELEITESTALFAAEATLHSVAVVTDQGVTLALDDFGTGYSAITALHRLPIHTVKIDRSFVADVVTEPVHRRARAGPAAAGPRHGAAGHRRGHRGPRPGRLAARPRLRHGPGLRVRPPRSPAQPGRGVHRRDDRRPGRGRGRRAAARRAGDPLACPQQRSGPTLRATDLDDTGAFAAGILADEPTDPLED